MILERNLDCILGEKRIFSAVVNQVVWLGCMCMYIQCYIYIVLINVVKVA